MMITAKVLGTGCAKCKKLFDDVSEAAKRSGLEVSVIKVTSLDEIIDYGVMLTPALVINEEVKTSGKLPTIAQIIEWISAGQK